MAYELTCDDLESLVLGGCFFGSGGGGTVTSARHLLAQFRKGAYYPSDSVTVVTVDEVQAGESVMVAYLGAPQAIDGARYPHGPVGAVEQVQLQLASEGRKLAYLAPPESGALGFVVACLVAARLGLRVIDADGAGRAVPSLPMLTYAVANIVPRPAFLVSQQGLRVELDVTARDGANGSQTHQRDVASILESMMRPIVADAEFAQFGGLAMWVMTPAQLPAALPIRGTLARALKTGRALRSGELSSPAAMIAFLREQFELHAIQVCGPGEFASAELSTAGGFDVGKVHILAADSTCTVIYQNESLLAWDSRTAHPIGMAPDSLAYFVSGPGQAVFSNGDVVQADGTLNPAVKNRTVTLLAWQADPALTTASGSILESFMDLLASIGYLGPYVPVGSLPSSANGVLQ